MNPDTTLLLARAAMAISEWEVAAALYKELDDQITSGGPRPLDWMVCAL